MATSLAAPARAAGPIVAVPSGDLSLWEGLSAIALGGVVAIALRVHRRRRARPTPHPQSDDDDMAVSIMDAVRKGAPTEALFGRLAQRADASGFIATLGRIEGMDASDAEKEACARAIGRNLAQMTPAPLRHVQQAMRTRRHLPQLCAALALRDMELGTVRSDDLVDMWLETAGDKLASFGDRDGAIRLYALQERVAEDEASRATGGGEGLAAADTMRRCREKIDRLLAAGASTS